MASLNLVRVISLTKDADLTLEALEAVAFEGATLSLETELLEVVEAGHAAMLAALGTGARVYGVTTGMGYLAGTDLVPADMLTHQRNLLVGRAAGSPPWLERAEARAVLTTRLANFLSGHAGVSPALCSYITERLNDDFVPAIPRRAAGSAGEVLPLAHAFQTFLGIGTVLGPDGAPEPAADALAKRGAEPYEPAAKEGVALLAGAPGALALAAARRREATTLADRLSRVWAYAIGALGAPLAPYDQATASLGNDPILTSVIEDLGGYLAGAAPTGFALQAPVSFRVIPQVATHLRRALARLEDDIRLALGAVTDSPAFVGGRFIGNGAFHAIELAAGMDTLGAAVIRSGELAAQHIHRLLDHRFSGLPDQLTPHPGPRSGLIVVQKRAAGVLNELRRLASPASVGLTDTSLGQEDAMTFGFEAAEKLRRIEELVIEIAACELVTARQAWALRGLPAPPGLAAMAALVEAVVPPVNEDRPLGGDIEAATRLLQGNEL